MNARARVMVAVVGALVVGATSLPAQQGPRGPRAGVGPDGAGVEALLRNREQLGLTEAQVASLEALRDELRAEMAPVREEMMAAAREARAEVRATREQRVERMRAFRDRVMELRESHRERLEQVLTEEQRAQLQELRWERSRRSAAWRRGGAGFRGAQPGVMGRGFRGRGGVPGRTPAPGA